MKRELRMIDKLNNFEIANQSLNVLFRSRPEELLMLG